MNFAAIHSELCTFNAITFGAMYGITEMADVFSLGNYNNQKLCPL